MPFGIVLFSSLVGSDAGATLSDRYRSVARLFGAIWLLGFPISVALFTFLYLKFESQEDWWFAVLLAGLAWFFFYGLFVYTLALPFPAGAALEGLDL